MKNYSIVFITALLSFLSRTSLSAPGVPSDSALRAVDSAEPNFKPLASKFWSTPNSPKTNPPEEPLWSNGLPDVIEISEKIEERATDRTNRWITSICEPTISIHRANGSKSAIVICPGGGYSGLAYDKEGHDIARWLNSLGVTGVVLKYRVKDYGQPAPGQDAQRAIALVRSRAEELELDPKQIGIMGFSAGGHVASTAGTRFCEFELDKKSFSSRPDFLILVYPVISMEKTVTHLGSRNGLLGTDPSAELVKEFSNDLHVTKDTPPTFLVHSADDRAVPIANSMRMLRALQKAGIPSESAFYEKGGHGFGLVTEEIPASEWPSRCKAWLRNRGMLAQE